MGSCRALRPSCVAQKLRQLSAVALYTEKGAIISVITTFFTREIKGTIGVRYGFVTKLPNGVLVLTTRPRVKTVAHPHNEEYCTMAMASAELFNRLGTASYK